MSRTLRIVFSKEKGIKKTWDYPSKRNYCIRCAHRHCFDAISVNGNKSLKKSKTVSEKRYQKEWMFPSNELDDDDG